MTVIKLLLFSDHRLNYLLSWAQPYLFFVRINPKPRTKLSNIFSIHYATLQIECSSFSMNSSPHTRLGFGRGLGEGTEKWKCNMNMISCWPFSTCTSSISLFIQKKSLDITNIADCIHTIIIIPLNNKMYTNQQLLSYNIQRCLFYISPLITFCSSVPMSSNTRSPCSLCRDCRWGSEDSNTVPFSEWTCIDKSGESCTVQNKRKNYILMNHKAIKVLVVSKLDLV